MDRERGEIDAPEAGFHSVYVHESTRDGGVNEDLLRSIGGLDGGYPWVECGILHFNGGCAKLTADGARCCCFQSLS